MRVASLVYTYGPDIKKATATVGFSDRFDGEFWCVESKDKNIKIPEGVTLIVRDFDRGGNLNGEDFLRNHIKIMREIFALGYDAIMKRDSDAMPIGPEWFENIPSDVPFVRGCQLLGCLSGGCYLANRLVPDALEKYMHEIGIKGKVVFNQRYHLHGEIAGKRTAFSAEDLVCHASVLNSKGIVEIWPERSMRFISHHMDTIGDGTKAVLIKRGYLTTKQVEAMVTAAKGLNKRICFSRQPHSSLQPQT